MLWEHIDNAQDFICIVTYAMDHKNVAGITLQKLRNAAKRGVKVFLVIDDLCFYANKEQLRALEKEGGFALRHNPTGMVWKHLTSGHPSRFFCRNHQKVMLVDGALFCGSLNLANSYTSVRYGDGSFRDINIILQRGAHPGGKRVRDFFRNMIIKNEYFYPNKIKPELINQMFDELDVKYAWQEAEEVHLEGGWPPKPSDSKRAKEEEKNI